jgi:hypothetical protein
MFTVRWSEVTRDQLADAWLQASDRNAVTTASSEIDHRLERNPTNEGESRPAGRRILIVRPLAVIYRVDEPNREVHVLRLWSI